MVFETAVTPRHGQATGNLFDCSHAVSDSMQPYFVRWLCPLAEQLAAVSLSSLPTSPLWQVCLPDTADTRRSLFKTLCMPCSALCVNLITCVLPPGCMLIITAGLHTSPQLLSESAHCPCYCMPRCHAQHTAAEPPLLYISSCLQLLHVILANMCSAECQALSSWHETETSTRLDMQHLADRRLCAGFAKELWRGAAGLHSYVGCACSSAVW